MSSSESPLTGLKILDLSRVLAGPLAAQILADLGAEVVKIERPGTGDDSRQWKKSTAATSDDDELNSSLYFWTFNRGKRSVTLDLTDTADRAVLLDLVKNADVLIENYKVGTLARYGLDYASLTEINSRLIYCSVTGFGQSGPYRHKPGYDSIIQAMGGLMSITGFPAEDGGRPTKTGVAISDQLTALYAVVAILSAVIERSRSQEGQRIDLALLDVQVSALSNLAMNYLNEGVSTGRLGNSLATVSPTDCFTCLDGEIMIIVGNDSQFRSFCLEFECSQWLDDPRFSTNSSRLTHRQALNGLLESLFAHLDVETCLRKMDTAGVPASRINSLPDLFEDEHVQARGMVRTVTTRSGKPYKVLRNPIVLSRSKVNYENLAPNLGDGNAALLHLQKATR